jgi:mannose-6-phosphate isomerase-like protein (cupin superfamily)
MEKVTLTQKFSLFSDYYNPRIVGRVNDMHVKVVKLKGEFMWHHHEEEDELFLVVKGKLTMRVREADGSEKEFQILPGEFLIIPRRTEHLPSAEEEVHIVLLEPASTLNTGNVRNDRTRETLQSI